MSVASPGSRKEAEEEVRSGQTEIDKIEEPCWFIHACFICLGGM